MSDKNNCFMQIVNRVDPTQIRVEMDGDDKIYVVPSATLPDNVIMNGGLYPAEEIAKSFQTLEDTPAPLGHPEDEEGNFISARSERGVNNYHGGAFNQNVRREGGRVYLEKRVNERVAKAMNRGPELLARLESTMRGEDTAPIHTSTGVFLHTEELAEARTNAEGKSYTWIAREMMFDHDAILLDEAGAATPEDGVGMMVNKGKSLTVNRVLVSGGKTSYTKPQADGGLNTNGSSNMLLDKVKSWLKANNVEVAETATEDEVAEALGSATIQANMDGDMQKKMSEMMSKMMEPMMSKMMKPMVSEMMKAYKGNSDDNQALADLKTVVDSLVKVNQDAEQAERTKLIEAVKGNSKMSEDNIKELSTNALREMAESVEPQKHAHHFGNGYEPVVNSSGSLSSDLPE